MLERMQSYSEAGFPSWEAFMAGDWNAALQLYEDERPGIAAFHEEFRRHRSCLYRVRVVAEPVTPYVRWELHCLKMRAECGEKIRVVSPSAISVHEAAGALPELISLCGVVIYHIIYDDREQPDGAFRYTDPELIARYENFARGLYETGEDVESYFRRAIAGLPPPPAQVLRHELEVVAVGVPEVEAPAAQPVIDLAWLLVHRVRPLREPGRAQPGERGVEFALAGQEGQVLRADLRALAEIERHVVGEAHGNERTVRGITATPRIAARNAADAVLSRDHTIVWFSSALITSPCWYRGPRGPPPFHYTAYAARLAWPSGSITCVSVSPARSWAMLLAE
jgi:hypothetical protein